jgi:short-subunit dehydrogenase
MLLSQKVVVITGASDGIGKQIAQKLAREHCQLALIARDTKKLEEVAEAVITLWASKVITYVCDISQTDLVAWTVEKIITDFETVDVLINNAGIWQKLMQLDELPVDIIDEVIRTNLLAVIHMTRLLLPVLRMKQEAAIINIISKSGVVAQAWQCVYTASKYGVRWFTEVLKTDLKDTNIKVAGIYQSGTNTKMFEKTGEDFPTDLFTDPADLADVITYVLSRPAKIRLHDIYVEK